MTEESHDRISRIIYFLKDRLQGKVPDIGIICGSGLGGLASTIQNPFVIPYSQIPGFPKSTVSGHASEMVIGGLGGKLVLAMKGRFHYYEGYHPSEVALPVRVLAALGVKLLIVTNAAGGVNPKFRVGDIMMIKDHIAFNGLAGVHPLVGVNDERFGPRFPLGNSYCPSMQQLLKDTAKALKIKRPIRVGTYCGVSGPSYETPAEIGMLRVVGGDAVGMSTVFESIVASHCGLKVLGLSLITNRCLGPKDKFDPPTHEEVLRAVKDSESEMQKLVAQFVKSVNLDKVERCAGYTYFSRAPGPQAIPAMEQQLAAAPPAASLASSAASAGGHSGAGRWTGRRQSLRSKL